MSQGDIRSYCQIVADIRKEGPAYDLPIAVGVLLVAIVKRACKAIRFGFNWPAGPLEMVAGAREGWQ